ncbi:MAG: peptide chain release factor N(5)-glutamine methyltransferase [Calditrichaeota bacterium]|nr:peptide chain release factor N(5)-glutamine methyltransferase [Calditrichota bacterium]
MLGKAGVDSPEVEAERLVMHVLHCQRADLYAAPERSLDQRQRKRFARLLARRLTREPLQYILGEVDFMGLTLSVSPAVLIPRPETETLVERALEFCRHTFAAGTPLRCLDVGTGCGNIAAALATYLPHSVVVAVDCSSAALAVARANLGRLRLGQQVRLVHADLREQDFLQKVGCAFSLVMANLPYVPAPALQALAPEVKDHEPLLALDGGPDGLDLYRVLIPLLPQLLSVGGAFFAEIGEGQGQEMRRLLARAGLVDIAVLPDLAGKERVVFARKGREEAQ